MTTQPSASRVDGALDEIASLAAKRRYGSFVLRLEILKPDQFVTANMTFNERSVNESEQELFDYPHVRLASFTCHVDMWPDFARRLVSGQLDVNGTNIPVIFSYAGRQEELYVSEGSSGPRDFRFLSSHPQEPYSARPLLGIGLPPCANLADASARFVHKSQAAASHIGEVNTFRYRTSNEKRDRDC